MGGKKKVRPQIQKTIIGSRTRTLSDGRTIQGIVYAPYLRGEDYICEASIVEDGVPNNFDIPGESPVEALKLIAMCLAEETDSYRFAGDLVQTTGFEVWHDDPDLNSLFEQLSKLEGMQLSIRSETVVRGRIHGKLEDVELIGPTAVTTLRDIDEISTVWSKIIRIRQRIRIRIVALAGGGNSELMRHRLFSGARGPVIGEVGRSGQPGAPVVVYKVFTKETNRRIDISIWVPRPRSGTSAWGCEYRIDGLSSTINAETLAVDSMRALWDAMDAIADELDQTRLTFGLTREEIEESPGESYHGFERNGISQSDTVLGALMEHLAAVEIQRNIILYKHATGELGVEGGEAEKKLHFHLREVERIRATFDPNYCAGNLKYPSCLD